MNLTNSDSTRVRAFIFDLDGTLVETERLKANAYAVILGRLTGANAPDRRAIELYERNVGATDEMICRKILDEFGIESNLPGTDSEPWRVLHEIRMVEYRANFGTVENLLTDSYAHNISLLKSAKARGYRVAVATSSFTDEAERVLGILGVREYLDVVVGRDQISKPKPDPEIYLETLKRLGSTADEAIVVEDSPTGVKAANSAGTRWICVSTPFSRSAIDASSWIDQNWVIHNPDKLGEVVNRRSQ